MFPGQGVCRLERGDESMMCVVPMRKVNKKVS